VSVSPHVNTETIAMSRSLSTRVAYTAEWWTGPRKAGTLESPRTPSRAYPDRSVAVRHRLGMVTVSSFKGARGSIVAKVLCYKP
jgi:hypothetical protein